MLKRKIYDTLTGIRFVDVTKDELSDSLIEVIDIHIIEFTHWVDDLKMMGLDLYYDNDITGLYEIYKNNSKKNKIIK